jgi:hypothetical protein
MKTTEECSILKEPVKVVRGLELTKPVQQTDNQLLWCTTNCCQPVWLSTQGSQQPIKELRRFIKLQEVSKMDVIYERCCGIDVHKKMVMACIIVKGKKEIREFAITSIDR